MKIPVFRIVSVTAILFLVLTGLAMAWYPGGTLHDAVNEGYSFTYNFYSDLGRVTSHRGDPKPISLMFFSLALTLSSAMILPMTKGITMICTPSPMVRDYLVPLSGMMAFFATWGYMGIALTPWDIYFRAHMGMVYTAFISFMFLSFLLGIILYMSDKGLMKPALLFLGFGVLQSGYLLLLFWGPRATDTATALLIQVAGQKVIVLTQAVVLFLVGVLLSRRDMTASYSGGKS